MGSNSSTVELKLSKASEDKGDHELKPKPSFSTSSSRHLLQMFRVGLPHPSRHRQLGVVQPRTALRSSAWRKPLRALSPRLSPPPAAGQKPLTHQPPISSSSSDSMKSINGFQRVQGLHFLIKHRVRWRRRAEERFLSQHYFHFPHFIAACRGYGWVFLTASPHGRNNMTVKHAVTKHACRSDVFATVIMSVAWEKPSWKCK